MMGIILALKRFEIAARLTDKAAAMLSREIIALVVMTLGASVPRTADATTVALLTTRMDGSTAGWDPLDPENLLDVQNFVANHWDELWNAGTTDGWPLSESEIRSQFRNPLPGDFGIVYHRWECVFRRIYASRLSNTNGEAYDLWDLMRDDPTVREGFRAFVLEGKIAPTISSCDVFYSHYVMLLEAESGMGEVRVADARVNEDGDLESVDMTLIESSAVASGPESEAEEAGPAESALSLANQRKLCDVVWWSRASLLACMYGEGLWQDDAAPDWFDCDDFMLAMRNWLKRRLGQDIVRPFLFRWRCPGEAEFRGHWMPVVTIGSMYYLIDPYTGEVLGPYPSTKAGRRAMARRGILTIETACLDAFGNEVEPQWDEEPRFFSTPHDVPPKAREPRPPFWNNPDSLSRFCARLALCCGRLPGESEQTSPACGPPPTGADNDSIEQAPCDGADYLPVPMPSVTWPTEPDCRNLQPN